MQTQYQPSWRDYVANVRSDAVDIHSPEVAVYAAENGLSMDDALEGYRHDFCFYSPTLQHWFPLEDGTETRDGWEHIDARFIGEDDMHFNYGFAR